MLYLISVLALPVMVVIVIPIRIADANRIAVARPASAWEFAAVAFGGVLALVGLALFSSSLFRFFNEGKGTLAPWDPPRKLVVRGPYRFVRNPMISGVCFLLVAEARALRSWSHVLWAGFCRRHEPSVYSLARRTAVGEPFR